MAQSERTSELIDRIEPLIDSGDAGELNQAVRELDLDDSVLLTSRLSSQRQVRLLELLPADISADIIHGLPFASATKIVEEMAVPQAAELLQELPTSEQADLVGEMAPEQAAAILAAYEKREADRVKSLVGYDDEVAGGLMDNRMLALDRKMTISTAVDYLRRSADEFRDFEVQYVYVIDQAGILVGVLRLRDLLVADGQTALESIMIKTPISVHDQMPLDKLRDFFNEYNFLGVPVVDDGNVLVGVVNRAEVERALGERATDDYLKAQGVIREELRTMPTLVRSRRRLMWLTSNIVLNVIAASVIAAYEETLKQVIALAVFLPIISDMSGCSGNQAVAVSMRELSLGLVEPREVVRVWLKEVSVGLINGMVLGMLLALLAAFWQASPWLGAVVGVALLVNTIIAVSIGGTLPLVMKLFGMDPALASGPILTTVTDLCGFFLVLGLASRMLPLLV